MQKTSKIIIKIFFILFFSFPSLAHVQHYDNLNSIEFDIYRNGKNIGKHIFSFKKSGTQLSVDSEINFEIKKLGVSLYKYNVKGVEVYENGKLIKFNSKTLQNKKSKFVNLDLKDSDFIIDGSSFKGKVPNDYVLGTWWNHSIVESKAQISAVSGRIIEQKVTFLGKKDLNINGKNYKALHFNFSSRDKNLKKNKKLDTDVWYDEATLNWIKASFDKKGKWEYKLISVD
jgi:hypothetical protein